MAISVGAKCTNGCVYTATPWCDVCGEQIEGECTGSHMFESGYCVICGAFDDSQEDWCEVNQGAHNVLFGSCTHCGKVFCYHTDMSDLHVVTKATCKDTGYGYRLCLDCGAEYGEIIARTAHDYKNGVCIACDENCPHQLSEWSQAERPACGEEWYIYRECSLCGFVEWKGGPAKHEYQKARCIYCDELQPGHEHYRYRTPILGDDTHQSICICGYVYREERHSFSVVSTESPVANHVPVKAFKACEECGYSRMFYELNPLLNVLDVSGGKEISYADLVSYDCLYVDCYGAAFCTGRLDVLNAAGVLIHSIPLPELEVGQRLLINVKTGFYSIWTDNIDEVHIPVQSSCVKDMAGVYYEFKPLVESVPSPLDKVNAYFVSTDLSKYDYPCIDASKDGTGFNRDYPMVGRGSGVNIQLISFPQPSIADFHEALEEYPLTLVVYDGRSVLCNAVTDLSDAFVSAYVKLNATNGGSHNGSVGDMGGSYAQGYADAYNTLTNAVIEKAPFQGFIQGMWYGVLAMVTILGNGISIGGISLFSILISALVILAGYIVLKVLLK